MKFRRQEGYFPDYSLNVSVHSAVRWDPLSWDCQVGNPGSFESVWDLELDWSSLSAAVIGVPVQV